MSAHIKTWQERLKEKYGSEYDKCSWRIFQAAYRAEIVDLRTALSAQAAAPVDPGRTCVYCAVAIDGAAPVDLHAAIMAIKHDCVGGENSHIYIAGFNYAKELAGDLARAAQQAPSAAPVDERASFEAWARTNDGNCSDTDLRHVHPGSDNEADGLAYDHQGVQRDWDVWQARAALAHPVAVDVPQWQPIEAAPKDGREVLLWLGAPWSKVEKARWFEPWKNWQRGDDVPDTVRDEYCGIGSGVPTRWMPLPQPPVAAVDAQGKAS